MNTNLMFSSENDEYSTPQDLYDKLNKEFNFTLDPCSTHKNAKCLKHYTKEDDGLLKDWNGEIVFMNPPYSKSENACGVNCKKKSCDKRGYHIKQYKPGQKDWIKKAYEEHKKGTIVVCLLPVRTDTNTFHNYIYNKAEIRFIKGRLKFGDSENSAPFPSMIVVYK
jgi:phage N-6-adenine-methyltransferase